jgi:hypothetical protein
MKRLLFLLTALSSGTLFAQVKIGGTGTPKASAVLEVDGGGTKGLLIPQVTQAQRATSIINPAQGLLVYQTDGVVGFYVNRSSIPSIPNWSLLAEGGSFWTTANSSSNDISNVNSGSVGIGTFAPFRGGLVVEKKVGAVNAIFGNSTTGIAIESSYPGIGFNTYYNAGRRYMTSGFGGYMGVDPFAGQFNIFMSDSNSTVLGGNASTDRLRFRIAKNGFIGIQGNDNPQAPLSFSNEVGDKINFYNNSSTSRYGIGLQGGRLQFYTTTASDVFQFGYGTSSNGAAFTETMRIQNNGNVGIGTASPNAKLDIGKGRLRFTGNPAVDVSTGIEFTTASGAALNGFYGVFNDSITGFYGYAGAGWSFLFNNKNGNLGLQGNTDPRAPLSFAAILGKKISLYRGSTGDAGFGVYGNELRIHSDYNGADITFGYDNLTAGFTERMRLKASGQLCLGTTQVATGYMLNIGGKIIAEEVRVQLKAAWPDYVFGKDYQLAPLETVENFIKTNNHLPNVPAAAEVEKSGIALGEMQGKLMEKVEELTLYLIEANKKIAFLQKEVEQIKSKK